MGDIGKAVRFIRNNLIALAVLSVWTVLAWLCQSWLRGLGAMLTIGAGLFVLRFVNWRKARLAMLAKADQPVPDLPHLFGRFALEVCTTLKLRREWPALCKAIPGLTSPNMKVAPRLHHIEANVNNELTATSCPGGVKADAAKFVKAQGDMAGMIRGFKLCGLPLVPACKDVRVRITEPGNIKVTFSYSKEFDKILSLADMPESPKGTLGYGDRPDGRSAWIWSHMSAMFGGLTRKGKSVLVKTLIASAHRQGLPLDLRIADTKLGIEFALFEKELNVQHGTVKVTAYEKTPEGAAAMVKDMAAEMSSRADMMREKNLVQWVPTMEHPQIVGFFDETLPLHAMLKEGTKGPAGQIAHSGAAMCVSLWLNTQIAHAAILGSLRELIPQRVCFATPTPQVTDTILGDGASANGAECHKLGNRAGVGWSGNDENGVPQKFRSANTTPAEAAKIAKGIVPPEWAERKPKIEPPKPYVLYRAFDDSTRWARMFGTRPVYIGITNDWPRRRKEHEARDWKWCPMHHRMENYWLEHVANWTVTPLGTTSIKVAKVLERKAIQPECPVFNDHHNRGGLIGRKVQGWFHRAPVAASGPLEGEVLAPVAALPVRRRGRLVAPVNGHVREDWSE